MPSWLAKTTSNIIEKSEEMIVVANESYEYEDSEKCSPEVVFSSSETKVHFRTAVPCSHGGPVGRRGLRVVKTT